jgi:hypothetical protein
MIEITVACDGVFLLISDLPKKLVPLRDSILGAEQERRQGVPCMLRRDLHRRFGQEAATVVPRVEHPFDQK